jgi:ring-1,2-phenylacetyl-CoA epoxidase subunit PaaD
MVEYINIDLMKTKDEILSALDEVYDPEIPKLPITDLGIVTSIKFKEDNTVTVNITPTFAGCPAIKAIEEKIYEKLYAIGMRNVKVNTNFDVQWNSDMITERGRKILKESGFAPPEKHNGFFNIETIKHSECPFCGSVDTDLKSTFGSTLCRAISYCNSCRQSFEQFKPVLSR